jgi:hypothetical protein
MRWTSFSQPNGLDKAVGMIQSVSESFWIPPSPVDVRSGSTVRMRLSLTIPLAARTHSGTTATQLRTISCKPSTRTRWTVGLESTSVTWGMQILKPLSWTAKSSSDEIQRSLFFCQQMNGTTTYNTQTYDPITTSIITATTSSLSMLFLVLIAWL